MKKSNKNRILSATLIALLLTASMGTLTSCGKKTADTENGTQVESTADSTEISGNEEEGIAADGTTEADSLTGENVSDTDNADSANGGNGSSSANGNGSGNGSNNGNGSGNGNGGNGGSSGGKTGSGSSVFACPSRTGQLQVIGAQLCSEDGTPVQLRGISTHGIAWFPEYVNSTAFSEFRNDWGANVMRLAMYTHESGGYCTDGDKTALLNTIDAGVQAAVANDMYVIIDWHVLNEGSPLTYQSQAEKFWKKISSKYASYNNVIYEICNEPCNGTSWSDIKSYANDIIPIIRANDDDAVIVVGTPNWSQEVDKAASDPITGYDNIMYTLHFYAATHKNDLRNKMEKAIKKGLPIIVTEYGICDASGNGSLDESSAAKWVSLMDEYGVSYVCWNLSNKNESSALINSSCSKTSSFAYSDLSGEGQWLYNLLSEKAKAEYGGTSSFGSGAASGGSGSGDDSASNNGGGNNSAGGSSSDNGSSGGNNSGSGSLPGAVTVRSGDFEVLATCSNSWDSGSGTCYQYTCSIKNASQSDVSSWSVSLNFDGNISLTNGWNGNYSVSGNTLTISSLDYNGSIAAGNSVTDVGFIVCGGRVTN